LRYYIFDLISHDGKSTRTLPLADRKRLLRKVVRWNNSIRFSRHIAKFGVQFFRAARRKGLEGIIAKRAQSHYHPGKRTREWLKIKAVRRQEAVIVGFTKPRKSRKYFGALVLAVRDRGAWRYVGHAGTGFSSTSLKSIYAKLAPLVRRKKPFAEHIAHETETAWVKPHFVCEVHFSEWTSDGQMRHPAFVGLRSDKPARNVVRERELHVTKR
jgi:bifunctional non-homologous end joining protein LigD